MRKDTTGKVKRLERTTLIATVDIGKRINMGYCRWSDGEESGPFEFHNNGRGFEVFWRRISQECKEKGQRGLIVGFESTGVYAEPLVHYLRKRGVKLNQVNPMHTKRLKEVYDNSPGKTDRKDPKVIADIIMLGHALSVVVPEGAVAELRRYSHARERGMRRCGALLNQLQDLVFLVFPEFLDVMRGVRCKSARYLLRHYPLPGDIVRYGCNRLARRLKEISRGRLGRERAEALYEAARRSVAVTEGTESICSEIKEILEEVEMCERFIARVERRMGDYLEKIPISRYLLSMRGLGKITVAGIIGEVGDFRMYRTQREVMKLAGLDLYEISSGAHRGKRRISKRGRPLLRKLLYYAAMNMVRRGGAMREKYLSYVERGMIRTKALVAIARKLLMIIFALVRDQKMYMPVREHGHVRECVA
jgi:transposase